MHLGTVLPFFCILFPPPFFLNLWISTFRCVKRGCWFQVSSWNYEEFKSSALQSTWHAVCPSPIKHFPVIPSHDAPKSSWARASSGVQRHKLNIPHLWMQPAPEHRAASPGLLGVSSLKEGATYSKLERKSIAKQMSRKDYDEESAESGTVWGNRYERMGSLRLGIVFQYWVLNTDLLSQF